MPTPGFGPATLAAAVAGLQKQIDRLARRPQPTGSDGNHPGPNLNSMIIGPDTSAGPNSLAIGSYADAAGSEAFGYNAVAVGRSTTAGPRSVAVGVQATANQADAAASGPRCVAVGFSAGARGLSSIALGTESLADGNQTLAIGDGATAYGLQSLVIGEASSTSVDAERAIAIGEQVHITEPDRAVIATNNLQLKASNPATDYAAGIILPSPDGTLWRVSVTDAGALTVTSA